MSSRLPVIAGLLVGLACALPAAADEVSTGADGGILHRRLPPPPGKGGDVPVFVYDPRRGGSLPREMQQDGQVLPMPPLRAAASDGESAYSEGGLTPADGADDGEPDPEAGTADGGPGDPTGPSSVPVSMDPRGSLGSRAEPDRETQKEGTLDYQAVFDPTVVPFKRNRALNTVLPDGTLQLEPGRLRRVEPVGNRVEGGREVFWGSVLVQAEAGRAVPLPSVSPDSRILSWEATPATPLTFLRDDADNLSLRTDRDARFRLVFLMDAPAGWFGRPIPPGLTVRDVPADLRPRVPADIGRRGRHVAAALGLGGEGRYDALVEGLVAHFRSFAPGDPPPESGDVYLDLALGMRGICRHRAYAFVVTAQALGIPARYVFNEAHVFVEVYVPGRSAGWLRIDLGGGAERLVVRGGADKVRHQARGRDPFARPEAYERQVTRGELAGATEVVGVPPTRRPGRTPVDGSGAGDPGALTGEPSALLPPPARIPREARRGAPTRTTLEAASLVFRGDAVAVAGQVTDRGGQPVADGQVQLVLLEGGSRRVLGLLGVAKTGADGRWEARVTLPADQAPGGYELIAEFLGSARLAPSRSP